MSTKIALATLAACLTALSVQGTASAQSEFSAAHDQAIKRFEAKVPSDAFGSIDDPAGTSLGRSSNNVVYGVTTVGRDPDPNVRFQIRRDSS